MVAPSVEIGVRCYTAAGKLEKLLMQSEGIMVGVPCGREWKAAEKGQAVPSGFSSTERHGLA